MHPQIYCVQSHQCFSASRVLDSRRVESRRWFFYCLCSILPHFPVHLLLYQQFLQAQSTAPHPRGVLCCPPSASIPRLDFSLTFCSCCATLSPGESSNIPSGDLFVVTVGEDSSFFQNVLVHYCHNPAIRGQLPAVSNIRVILIRRLPDNLLLWNIFFCIPIDKFKQFCYFNTRRLTRVLSLSCFVSCGAY